MGAMVSTTVAVVLAGLLSPIPLAVRAGLLLAALVALMVRASDLVSFPLPQNSRQIPQEAFRIRPTHAAFRFAFELGTAARTYVTTEAPYAGALVVALLLPAGTGTALAHAAAIALGFGVGRTWIVGTQVFRSAMIVEHPRWALMAGNALALAVAAWISISALASIGP